MGRKRKKLKPGPWRDKSDMDAFRQQVVEMAKTRSMRETASAFNISVDTVSRYCRSLGVRKDRSSSMGSKTFEILRDIILDAGSYDEIGERHGVSRQRVGLIKRQAEESGLLAAIEKVSKQ